VSCDPYYLTLHKHDHHLKELRANCRNPWIQIAYAAHRLSLCRFIALSRLPPAHSIPFLLAPRSSKFDRPILRHSLHSDQPPILMFHPSNPVKKSGTENQSLEREATAGTNGDKQDCIQSSLIEIVQPALALSDEP